MLKRKVQQTDTVYLTMLPLLMNVHIYSGHKIGYLLIVKDNFKRGSSLQLYDRTVLLKSLLYFIQTTSTSIHLLC